MVRMHQQATRMRDPIQEQIPYGKHSTINKMITPKLREVQSPCSTASPQARSLMSEQIRHALTLQRTGDKPMAVRIWRMDENLMAIKMQRTGISLMVVGA